MATLVESYFKSYNRVTISNYLLDLVDESNGTIESVIAKLGIDKAAAGLSKMLGADIAGAIGLLDASYTITKTFQNQEIIKKIKEILPHVQKKGGEIFITTEVYEGSKGIKYSVDVDAQWIMSGDYAG